MSRFALAILISGGGTTLENLIRWQQRDELPVEFELVISSRADARGLQIAEQVNIPTAVISRKQFPEADGHSEAIFSQCRKLGIDLVVMGGYLEHLKIPDDFLGRVVNIHPSLIPAFSGKGFYGLRVHQAALDFGVLVSGCTVHFVDNEFDHGPIIAQRTCPVFAEDTPETLAKRVFEVECQLFPEVIKAIALGNVTCHNRKVCVKGIL